MRQINLVGAGGHGKVAADTALQAGFNEVVFYDDTYPNCTSHRDWKVVGTTLEAALKNDVFISIGDNAHRRDVWKKLKVQNAPTLIHPTAHVSRLSSVGDGVLIVAGAIVNAAAIIERGAILNTACTVDHDVIIGEFAHISPGVHLAGGVQVGAESWVGIGATVIEGVRIGDRAIVGAGAVVVRDVEEGQTVMGNPARPKEQPC